MVGAHPGGVHPCGVFLPAVLRRKALAFLPQAEGLWPSCLRPPSVEPSDAGDDPGPQADHGDEQSDGRESGGFLNKNTDHVDLPRT